MQSSNDVNLDLLHAPVPNLAEQMRVLRWHRRRQLAVLEPEGKRHTALQTATAKIQSRRSCVRQVLGLRARDSFALKVQELGVRFLSGTEDLLRAACKWLHGVVISPSADQPGGCT